MTQLNNKFLKQPRLRFEEFEKNKEYYCYKLNELVEIHYGQKPIIHSEGFYKIISGGVLPLKGKSKSYNIKEPVITISSSGSCGFVSYYNEPIWVTSYCFILKNIKKIINFKLLYYYLKKYEFLIQMMARGNAVKNLNRNHLGNYLNIKFPSLPEQKKIASFLNLLDERIKIQSEIIKDIALSQKYYLNQLMEGYLRFEEFSYQHPSSTYLLGGLVEFKRGEILNSKKFNPNGNYYVMGGGRKPFGFYDFSNTSNQTLTISVSGDYCGYPYYHDCSFWATNVCYRLIPKKLTINKLNFKYLYYWFRKMFYFINCLKQGYQPPNLNRKILFPLKISLPSLPEQKKIASFLTLLDEKKNLEKDLCQNYQLQKKYYLNNLLI